MPFFVRLSLVCHVEIRRAVLCQAEVRTNLARLCEQRCVAVVSAEDRDIGKSLKGLGSLFGCLDHFGGRDFLVFFGLDIWTIVGTLLRLAPFFWPTHSGSECVKLAEPLQFAVSHWFPFKQPKTGYPLKTHTPTSSNEWGALSIHLYHPKRGRVPAILRPC